MEKYVILSSDEVKSVNLSNENLKQLPSYLFEYVNLEYLTIEGNKIASLYGLERLDKLKVVSVANNKIEDLTAFCFMHNLQYLDARGNNIDLSKQSPIIRQKIKEGIIII